MSKVILNVIHLPSSFFVFKSTEYYESIRRKESFTREFKEQGIWYYLHDGVLGGTVPTCTAIAQAHKRVVQKAKEIGLEFVAIAEDDIVFNGAGAWQYFLDNMPESFDIYMGVSYFPETYENGIVNKPFDSMSLYIIHSRFYNEFLALPEDNHIDRELSKLVNKKEIRISPLYVVHQLNGYSFNAKHEREYHQRIEGMPKFGVSS